MIKNHAPYNAIIISDIFPRYKIRDIANLILQNYLFRLLHQFINFLKNGLQQKRGTAMK